MRYPQGASGDAQANGTSAVVTNPSASEVIKSATSRQQADLVEAQKEPATSRLGKRPTISPSTSEEAPLPKRPARFAEPGKLSGKSTTGRSFRVRMPKAEEPPSNGHTPRRATRSSTRSVVDASDSAERTPDSVILSDARERGVEGGVAQGDNCASEGSEGGFEFDDDF